MKNKSEYRCILLGETGSGKSTFINYLTNYFHGNRNIDEILLHPEKFKLAIPTKNWQKNVLIEFKEKISEKNIKNNTQSQTSKCSEYSFLETNLYHFIDTPGFNDTNGTTNDEINLNTIINACKSFEFINSIILILNGSDTRLTRSIKSIIENLNRFLPNTLLDSVLVVLTNCDELSCNLSLNDLNVKFRVQFYMQNSLIKWNGRDEIVHGSHSYEKLKNDWHESIQTIEEILNEITKQKPISTCLFKQIETKNQVLYDSIEKQLHMLIGYLKNLKSLESQKLTITNSFKIMSQNLVHEKELQINAIPLGGENEVKIDVQLFDNVAKCNFNESFNDYKKAHLKMVTINQEIKTLKAKMNDSIVGLSKNVLEMRHLCCGFNFINEFSKILSEFERFRCLETKDKLTVHYHALVLDILEGRIDSFVADSNVCSSEDDEKMDVDEMTEMRRELIMNRKTKSSLDACNHTGPLKIEKSQTKNQNEEGILQTEVPNIPKPNKRSSFFHCIILVGLCIAAPIIALYHF